MEGHPPSLDAVILSFRTMFSGEAARDFKGTLELRIGQERFRAKVAREALDLTRGAADRPDAILDTDAATLVAVAYGGRKFHDAVKAGELRVEGDKTLARQFFTLFPLPAPRGDRHGFPRIPPCLLDRFGRHCYEKGRKQGCPKRRD